MTAVSPLGGFPLIPLEEVAELKGGYAFKSTDYKDKGAFVLRTLNIGADGSITRENAVFIDENRVPEFERFNLVEWDTVFVMVGATLGKTGLVRPGNLPALLNQNMWVIRAKRSLMDPRFLHYMFASQSKTLLGWASGAARDFVRRDDFRKLMMPIPPLAEQRAIAGLLGALDDKIESNNRITEIALKLISTKFEMEESLSVERIPLSSLISLERGREPGREMCREDGVGTPFIRVSNLKMETHRGLTLTDFEGPLAKADDVLISFDGTPGRVAFGLIGYFSSGVRRALPASFSIPTSLTWAMLSGESVQRVISEFATGTTIQHAGSALEHLTAPLLSATGFYWFENEGENLWRYILSLRRSSETLFSFRTSLSVELLSGRFRVKDPESMMENV